MKIKPLLYLFSSVILIVALPLIAFANPIPNIDSIVDDDEGDVITTVIESTETTKVTNATTETTSDNTTTKRGGVFLGSFNITSEREEETTQENTVESTSLAPSENNAAHTHDWHIISFVGETGEAVIKCSGCNETYTDYIFDHFFDDTHQTLQPSDEPFDVVSDGTINAKDYAYLFKQYYSYYNFLNDFFTSKQFLYKEKFVFVYITVLFIISTGCICFSLRRVK